MSDKHLPFLRGLNLPQNLKPGSFYLPNLAINICRLTAPDGVTEAELEQAARSIKCHCRAPTPWDDDVYYMGQSPFNEKWYVFACSGNVGTEQSPSFVFDAHPEHFNDSDRIFW